MRPVIVVLVLGLALLLAYLFFPKATVVLQPPTQAIEETLELRADPAALAVDVRGKRVPARVGYVVEDLLEQVVTQGRTADPAARAIGTVTLTSRLGGAASVPAGTLVSTASGVKFTTGADAQIEASAGATARVPIQALEAGASGNVGRLEVSQVIGPLRGQVVVLNEEPTVGGGEGQSPVVTAEDLD